VASHAQVQDLAARGPSPARPARQLRGDGLVVADAVAPGLGVADHDHPLHARGLLEPHLVAAVALRVVGDGLAVEPTPHVRQPVVTEQRVVAVEAVVLGGGAGGLRRRPAAAPRQHAEEGLDERGADEEGGEGEEEVLEETLHCTKVTLLISRSVVLPANTFSSAESRRKVMPSSRAACLTSAAGRRSRIICRMRSDMSSSSATAVRPRSPVPPQSSQPGASWKTWS